MQKIKDLWNKVVEFWNKVVELFKEKTKDIKWAEVWDKCTTGLLIFLMCSPVLILAYIFLWFAVFRGI